MRKKALLFFFFLVPFTFAQNIKVEKIEPPNWWIGMKWNKVQLMVYGSNLKNISANFENKELKVISVHNAESSSYSFIEIEIPPNLQPGLYKLNLKNKNSSYEITYPLLGRSSSKDRYQGFNQSDVIYLITPDRFADGDTSNNIIKGMINEYNINNPSGRHGGDIQGIINHLNYIKGLGVTAIWINPLVENNTHISYHGYSATDFYKIYPRFGTFDLYKKLVNDAHSLGLKIIWDHVNNHISIDHPWMKDLPFKDWINGTVNHHQMTRHDKLAFADIHRDSSTIINTTKGWFTNEMPDLNQTNPYLSNYLIENTIWWIEATGIDGIREDTYPYSDQLFLSKWAKSILTEYPKFNIVGEVWTGDAVFLSSFQKNSFYPKKINSYLPSLTDYATYDTYTSFLKGTSNLSTIYEDYAKDFIYSNPNDLLTFIDNHDVPRALLQSNGNIKKFEMALMMLLTSRGIPEIYYGTEIGIEGGRDDGSIRADFPGGFPLDTRNAFTSNGRTKTENEIYNFVHHLLQLRKTYKSLSIGTLIQFPPANDVFIYFKIYKDEKMMVVLNNNNSKMSVDLHSVNDQLTGREKLKDLLTGKIISLNDNTNLKVDEYSCNLFQLLK